MGRNEKISFIIFVILAIILITVVNLVIKRYEKEDLMLTPQAQELTGRKQGLADFRDIEGREDIKQERQVSGPLVY